MAVPKRNRAGGYKYTKQSEGTQVVGRGETGHGVQRKSKKKWVGRLREARGWTRVRLQSKLEGRQAGR